MRESISGLDVTQHFDSWGDFLESVSRESNVRDSDRASRGSFDRSTQSFDEAIKLATEGWSEGEKKASRFSLSLFDKLSSLIEQPTVFYDVEGTQIDVARYLDGEPECWQRTEYRNVEGVGRRIIRIVMACTVSGGTSDDVIMARGSVVCALVNLLEFSGHGVELTVAAAVGNHKTDARCEQFVTVKTADQPLDLSRVAYALAHPSMFRRLFWSLQEMLPNNVKDAYSFHRDGTMGSGRTSDRFEVTRDGMRGDVYLGGAHIGEVQWRDDSAATYWILSNLKSQGVHLREE